MLSDALAVARETTIDRLAGWSEYRRHDFSTVQSFLVFAGFPRSGHTLVGALLTAHPNAVVSHELHALQYVRRHVDRAALFGLIARRDRQFADSGSRWTGYDYAVPGQWQGRHRALKIIGDKKGGGTALLLHRRPELLERLKMVVRVPVKYVVVTRHPVDNIARMASKNMGIEQAVLGYFDRADAVEWLVSRADCLIIRHEKFTHSPTQELARLLGWLDLHSDVDYLEACGSIVRESRRAREAVDWTPETLAWIRRESRARPTLAEYYDSGRWA